MDLQELKNCLSFEYAHRTDTVFHVQCNKSLIAQVDMSQNDFGLLLLDHLSGVMGFRRDSPLISTTEMNNKKGAHYHYAVYLDENDTEKYKRFAAKVNDPMAVAVVSFKKKLASLIGIEEAKASKEIGGITFTAPAVKVASMIDYFIKEGTQNFKYLNFNGQFDPSFDPSEPVIRKYYRKNSGTSRSEGGVRSLFPSRKGPNARRGPIEGDFIDELVNRFVEKKSIPTEAEFRIFMHQEYSIASYSDSVFKLVIALVEKELGINTLMNPRDAIQERLRYLKDEFSSFMELYSQNRESNAEAFRHQTRYIKSATETVNSQLFAEIFAWIAEFMCCDQSVRNAQKNKALFLMGPSNAGKTAFHTIIFPEHIFGSVGMTLTGSYATRGMYSSRCMLWLFRDINRGMTAENLLQLQNLISGDESRRQIRHEEIQGIFPSRPIVACTTTDILGMFDKVTAGREDDLLTRVQQFKNRIKIVTFPASDEKVINDKGYLRGPLIEFLVQTDKLKVPEWMPFYLFWTEYFEREAELLEQLIPDDALIDEIFSLGDSVLEIEQLEELEMNFFRKRNLDE